MESSGPVPNWDDAAQGWSEHADQVFRQGTAVSAWLLDHAGLQPGQRVLELAAGPGDTGFLAAELIEPGGVLISSDASEAMLDVARGRAEARGLQNVEFRPLELEWLDLDTASVDVILCRWAYMLASDPEAAFREARRVLRPGGRLAFAVWDREEQNPWATAGTEALAQIGLASPPREGPGRFALADREQLEELLGGAGFVEIVIDVVDVPRVYDTVAAFLDESRSLSPLLRARWAELDAAARDRFVTALTSVLTPYTDADGVRLPGRSIVAAASG